MSHTGKWLTFGIALVVLAALVPVALAQGSPAVRIAQRPLLYIAPPAANSPVVDLTKNATLGDILTFQGITLYRLEKDQPNVSTCTGQCATIWPPFLIAGGEPQAGMGLTGKLGVITRADGSKQVTYAGDPLYFYAKDMRPGDITGEDVGSVWYAVTVTGDSAEPPSGSAATEAPAAPQSSGQSSSSSGW